MKTRKISSQKILILLISIFLLSLVTANSASAALSCIMEGAGGCTGGRFDIFHMSATNNGHAELSSQSNLPYINNRVCCSGAGLTGTSCSGTYVVVLKLSSLTNAHAQQNGGSYSNNVCISATAGYSVGVTYGSCSGDYVCLASISDQLNGHVGDCSAYTTKVCAKVSALSELCSNGIDDDEDLLIDCDDPDCSQLDLDCVVPGSGSCSSRVWQGGGAGDCGRLPQNITCPDKLSTSHTVCLTGHNCATLEPTFGSFSVSPNSTTVTTGSFIISTVTTCPVPSLPGKCLVECKVDKPGGGDCITFDTWNKTGNARFTVAPDQLGVWNVSQCGIYTDFFNNLGWGTTNNAKKSICVHDGTGGWYNSSNMNPQNVCCTSNVRDLDSNGVNETCGAVGDCSTLTPLGEATCEYASECDWCTNSGGTCINAPEQCDGSTTCNGDNTAKCNTSCQWETCPGGSWCSNGVCSTCGSLSESNCKSNPSNCVWCTECNVTTNKSSGLGSDICRDIGLGCPSFACHKGNCSADCTGISDCGPRITFNYCYYNGACDTAVSCLCSFESEPCIPNGTVISGVCYYNPSGPDCDNSGCHVSNCTLGQYEECDSVNGCECCSNCCNIGGVCYQNEVSNPGDSCQICDVSEDPNGWTDITACIGDYTSDGCCPSDCSEEDSGNPQYDYDCFLMRAHPLAYLFAHNITLMLGQGGIIKAQVRNLQENNDTIKLGLTGDEPYLDLIEFMDSPNLECFDDERHYCQISLNPYEKRKLFIKISPSPVIGSHELHLNASSSLNATLKDHDAARINVVYPSEFSELGSWAIIILMFFAVLIYSKMIKPVKNSAGKKIKNIERKIK